MKPATTLHIGELAARTGASRRSLRYYESQGLLHAERGPNGYRYYDLRSVAVVERIKELLAMGLPTWVVRGILPCVLDLCAPSMGCPQLQRVLREELERLDAVAAEVNASRHRIGALLDAATNWPPSTHSGEPAYDTVDRSASTHRGAWAPSPATAERNLAASVVAAAKPIANVSVE